VTQSSDHEVSDPAGKQTEGRGVPIVNDEPQVTEEEAVEGEIEEEIDPLAEVTRERDDYLDALQRLKAEFDNYRKRAAREQRDIVSRAAERLVKELLPVLDDLERALTAAEEHEEAKLEDGVRLVQRALADAMQREGLAEIETNGKFDPHIHEALLSQPAEGAESGDIVQVLQKGYRLGDKVLRPARVIVAE
jgi:molecular chaperone GrpE